MRRIVASALFAAVTVLAACSEPIRSSDPLAAPLGRDAAPGALTVTGADASPGREPLLPSAARPDLRGGTLLQGPPGTPMGSPGLTSPAGPF